MNSTSMRFDIAVQLPRKLCMRGLTQPLPCERNVPLLGTNISNRHSQRELPAHLSMRQKYIAARIHGVHDCFIDTVARRFVGVRRRVAKAHEREGNGREQLPVWITLNPSSKGALEFAMLPQTRRQAINAKRADDHPQLERSK